LRGTIIKNAGITDSIPRTIREEAEAIHMTKEATD